MSSPYLFERRKTDATPDPLAVFSGGGEMGELMRAFDWSQTPIGPAHSWPQSLKTAVRIILTSRYPMFVWWGKELINLYNDPYRAFLGIKHPTALGKSARDIWAEIWDEIGPRTEAVLERGESTFDEGLMLLMDRHGYTEETYFTFSYSPLPDDQGNVAGIFCAVTEVTQEVIGGRRLTLMREIASEMGEGRTPQQVGRLAARTLSTAQRDLPFSLIYLLDSDGKTLNRVGEAGIDSDHAAAPASIALDADADSPWPLRHVIESGETVLLDNVRDRIANLPSGPWSDSPNCVALLPLARQGQSHPAGVFVAGLNPYRKFGEQFRGFLSLLSNQIAGAIANAVAYETERRRAESLAEIDRAKTQFFSNVSHEFRTPLTLILGPLEEALLESREKLSPEGHAQLVAAHRNALRLLKLVNNLLDFSRIEAGRMQAVYQPTNLAALTAEIASAFRSTMEQAGLRFVVTCETIGDSTYVDRDMWEKIVLNLLSNAFKFTLAGEVTVSLKSHGDAVELAVRDTGLGIAAHELPRVFERFHRIENTSARTFEGTGIGLALVQELARLHGGSVRVESSPGKGSTFIVSIPRGTAHLPADRIQEGSRTVAPSLSYEAYIEEAGRWVPETGPRMAAAEPHAETERELVLIADDNADMREYLARLLEGTYSVYSVADGAQAIDAIHRLRPDLVLTDIMMPGTDGFAVLNAVRRDHDLRGTPVILLSARAGEESRVEGLEAGADDYLVKPFTARELLARVATHLRLAKMHRESTARELEFRAQAEREHQRLAAIVGSSDDAIVSKDLNGIVTSWNAGAERIFGYTAAEIVGKPITTIIPLELHGDEDMILGKIRRGERIEHFETERLTKTGERVNVSLSISPVKDEHGKIVGAAKIARDITTNKKIERSLRTAERLATAGRLAATVAHEINNPLEAVVNLVYLAQHDLPDVDKVGQYLEAARLELNRVAHITRQTLGFYRDPSSPVRFNMSKALDDLLALYEKRLQARQITIVKQYDPDAEIVALTGEVRQAFSNLLTNAMDATTRNGTLVLRVRRSQSWTEPYKKGVRVTVADTGTGIAKEHRDQLFQPFFTTKSDVGTGLGLWITHSIVEKHGGKIRIKSSTAPHNHGTAVSIFLPETPAAAVLPQSPARSQAVA